MLAVVAAIVAGCGNGNTGVNPGTTNGKGENEWPNAITGTVSNVGDIAGLDSQTHSLKLVAFDEYGEKVFIAGTWIGADGSFSLKLPETVDERLQVAFASTTDGATPSLDISGGGGAQTPVAQCAFYVVGPDDKNYLFQRQQDGNLGTYANVSPVFASADLRVLGTHSAGGYTEVYDIEYKAGWNWKFWLESGKTLTYTTTEPDFGTIFVVAPAPPGL